jgi:hypothetical protein
MGVGRLSYNSHKETEKNYVERIRAASKWTAIRTTYLPNKTLQSYIKSNMFTERQQKLWSFMFGDLETQWTPDIVPSDIAPPTLGVYESL